MKKIKGKDASSTLSAPTISKQNDTVEIYSKGCGKKLKILNDNNVRAKCGEKVWSGVLLCDDCLNTKNGMPKEETHAEEVLNDVEEDFPKVPKNTPHSQEKTVNGDRRIIESSKLPDTHSQIKKEIDKDYEK